MYGVYRVQPNKQDDEKEKEIQKDVRWSIVYLASSLGLLASFYYVHRKTRNRLEDACRSYHRVCQDKTGNVLSEGELNAALHKLSYVKLRLVAINPNLLRKLVHKEKDVDSLL